MERVCTRTKNITSNYDKSKFRSIACAYVRPVNDQEQDVPRVVSVSEVVDSQSRYRMYVGINE